MNRPLIIEFVGLPGAGKTTIVDSVIEIERQESRGVFLFHSVSHVEHSGSGKTNAAARLFRAVVTVCLVFWKKPRMMLQLLKYGILAGPLSRSRIGLMNHFIRLAREIDRKRSATLMEHEIELLDQGLIQCLGSIALPGTTTSSRNLEALVPRALNGWIDGLVWIECDPGTAMLRVRSRADKRNRFESWPDDVFRQNQSLMLKVLHDATQIAMSSGIPVLTVPSADPVLTNAARVRAWLLHALSSFPRQHNTINSA